MPSEVVGSRHFHQQARCDKINHSSMKGCHKRAAVEAIGGMVQDDSPRYLIGSEISHEPATTPFIAPN
jgi:hypothetical protein